MKSTLPDGVLTVAAIFAVSGPAGKSARSVVRQVAHPKDRPIGRFAIRELGLP
jgi:hypothetical protein